MAGIYICGCDFHAVISKPWLFEAIKVCGCGSGAVIYKPSYLSLFMGEELRKGFKPRYLLCWKNCFELLVLWWWIFVTPSRSRHQRQPRQSGSSPAHLTLGLPQLGPSCLYCLFHLHRPPHLWSIRFGHSRVQGVSHRVIFWGGIFLNFTEIILSPLNLLRKRSLRFGATWWGVTPHQESMGRGVGVAFVVLT